MKFRFDELNVEKQFRERLDIFLPGVMLLRPKRSKKTVDSKMGTRVIVLDKLARQNNEDVMKILVRQITDALATGVARLYGTTSCIFVPGPLEFEYIRDTFDEVENEMSGHTTAKNGTIVTITMQIKEE